MKVIYLKNTHPIDDDLRVKLSGCRVENADAFQGVSSGIDVAEIYGDYPNIEEALKEAGIEFTVHDVDSSDKNDSLIQSLAEYISENKLEKLKVKDAKEAGFDVSGDDIKAAFELV